MKYRRYSSPSDFKLLIGIGVLFITVLMHGAALGAARQEAGGSIDAGYSALKLFLKDERRLTAIRRVKMILSFRGISRPAKTIIDEIADSSDQALEDLEKLAALEPVIVFEEFSDDSIGKATFDSLRITTAKEFMFGSGDFEKNLLLSQSQILPVISHLARQLAEKETSLKRKDWLNKLAERYDNHYRQVFALITITTKSGA